MHAAWRLLWCVAAARLSSSSMSWTCLPETKGCNTFPLLRTHITMNTMDTWTTQRRDSDSGMSNFKRPTLSNFLTRHHIQNPMGTSSTPEPISDLFYLKQHLHSIIALGYYGCRSSSSQGQPLTTNVTWTWTNHEWVNTATNTKHEEQPQNPLPSRACAKQLCVTSLLSD